MKHARVLLALAAAIMVTSRLSAQVVVSDDFSKVNPGRYEVKSGDWKVVDGKYVHITEKPYGFRWVVADFPFTEGTVEVEAIPRKEGLHGSTSVGLVAKYVDDDNYWRVQFGTYGRLRVSGRVAGEGWGSDSRLYAMEVDKTYKLSLVWRDAEVGVFVDRELVAVIADPFAGQAGKPGFFTETVAEFDNLTVRVTRP